jgi:hypothetical protein
MELDVAAHSIQTQRTLAALRAERDGLDDEIQRLEWGLEHGDGCGCDGEGGGKLGSSGGGAAAAQENGSGGGAAANGAAGGGKDAARLAARRAELDALRARRADVKQQHSSMLR